MVAAFLGVILLFHCVVLGSSKPQKNITVNIPLRTVVNRTQDPTCRFPGTIIRGPAGDSTMITVPTKDKVIGWTVCMSGGFYDNFSKTDLALFRFTLAGLYAELFLNPVLMNGCPGFRDLCVEAAATATVDPLDTVFKIVRTQGEADFAISNVTLVVTTTPIDPVITLVQPVAIIRRTTPFLWFTAEDFANLEWMCFFGWTFPNQTAGRFTVKAVQENSFRSCNIIPIYAILDIVSTLNILVTTTRRPNFGSNHEVPVVSTPRITSVSPDFGSIDGGTPVSIFGSGFAQGPSVNVGIDFGDIGATGLKIMNDSHVTLILPSQARPITPIAPKKRGDILHTFNLPIAISLNAWWDYEVAPINFTYFYKTKTPDAPRNEILEFLRENLWIPILGGAIVIVVFVMSAWACARRDKGSGPKRITDPVSNEGYERLTNLVDELGLSQKALIKEGDIEFGKRIGTGSFADVYEGSWRHVAVAIKKLRHCDNPDAVTELIQEAKVMVHLRHPNVVSFLGICAVEPDLCIVSELVRRGCLSTLLKNPNIVFENEHLRKMALDTCYGIEYLHEMNLIHRDLKCRNLLVTQEWSVKVADFGLSKFVEEQKKEYTLTACGTPVFAAPEVLNHQKYTFSADVYSFGMILFEMWTKASPFADLPPYRVVVDIMQRGIKPNFPPGVDVPKEITATMMSCLDYEPSERPSVADVIQKLDIISFEIPDYPHPREIKSVQAADHSDFGAFNESMK